MRRLLPCALAALTLTSCGIVSAQTTAPTTTVAIDRVIDGDTVVARDKAGKSITVRILGIDTPETVAPGKPVQCWGPEATQYAKRLLLNQVVRLRADPTQAKTDAYKRSLFYVVLPDGRDFSVEAARAGAARSYVYGGKPVQRHAQIVAAELEAKQARRGMWGGC